MFRRTPEGLEFDTPDGTFRVEGYVDDGRGGLRCPTEKCGAYCCRKGSLWPGGEVPCPYLHGELCSFQVIGGIAAKPFGCVMYPRSQADVDAMNVNASGDERCYLKVVQIG